MSGEIASDNIFIPEAANKWVCGSSWGWLVLEGTNSREVSLLNPFTRRVIRLPPVDAFTGETDVPVKSFNYIHKAILSSNPAISKQDCIIMAIFGPMGKLSYCKIGDKKWTNIDCPLSGLCDVIYYNGKFYATTKPGALMSCDIMDLNFTKIVASAPHSDSSDCYSNDSNDYCYSRRKYLVMASGCLLLIRRIPNNRFKLHLLNKCSPFALYHNRQYKWVEIDSIELKPNCTQNFHPLLQIAPRESQLPLVKELQPVPLVKEKNDDADVIMIAVTKINR
ncbi:putative F-box protein [Carex littledalei]|uniref:Putative F-box protein n=1 Tax=Carex littledalei TaxID=544730 RepID=A0A833RG61_9POAL|nr:putative F-box protein [Carex littledalei]